MSAILGRIEFDGRPVSAKPFSDACAAISHYGPDDRGELVSENAAFAHFHLEVARRQVRERQPLTEGAFMILADAILDDRDGLARSLAIEPAAAEQMPDSALILKAWAKWGEDCPHHLVGDFAFAIWDGDRRRLFLARDHIGTRPLYWSRRGASFLFATDIRGLVAFTEFDWAIDEKIVALYMTNADRPLPKCFFEEMYFVEPGHHLTVTAEGETASRWWDPTKIPLQRGIDATAAASRLRELVELAVDCRIDTDHPVGSHISGGIDSTSVTVIAARELRERGRTLRSAFCWAPEVSDEHPDMGPRDERRLISTLAEAEGVRVRYGSANGEVFATFLKREIELEGTADLLDEVPILEQASEDGVRVLLSGWGGDEVVSSSGVGYLSSLLQRGRLPSALRAVRAMNGGRRNPRVLAKTLWSWGLVPMLPGRLFDIWSPYARMYPRRSFMSKSLADRLLASGLWRKRDVRPIPDPRKYMGLLLQRGHLASRMASWASWSARKEILYRYPLLDRRVLEFVLSLPPEVSHGVGEGRRLFRMAMSSYLPGRTNKYDPANERMRARARLECWHALASNAHVNHGSQRHDWLDTDALQRQIDAVPEKIGLSEVVAFAEVCSAMRIWYLDGRFG
jgi:asparagine synthase (glutamine-hydrolysing)